MKQNVSYSRIKKWEGVGLKDIVTEFIVSIS